MLWAHSLCVAPCQVSIVSHWKKDETLDSIYICPCSCSALCICHRRGNKGFNTNETEVIHGTYQGHVHCFLLPTLIPLNSPIIQITSLRRMKINSSVSVALTNISWIVITSHCRSSMKYWITACLIFQMNYRSRRKQVSRILISCGSLIILYT